MKFHVRVALSAKAAIDEAIGYIAVERQAPQAAARLLERIWDAIDSLEQWPKRCSLAPENEFRDYEIRMRLVASFLILFTVNDDARTVQVIGFRHGSRLPIDSDLPPKAE
ncbi:type II toxin-antitoxin system RelE/ParE family toxin [Lignipirellula cremea]|uniref:Plasmid stabilization system protein n=1 Tax=Lignipirellula cremea TaxID=2528010 RepID=A0A518E3E7_9BACT|nr:type II toxin-antitoxin system RelE/ParE family toxin [Lignipirellula cremea]QDU98592.1 Plasmid stabilization system protein [Lignipirellula cremea]